VTLARYRTLLEEDSIARQNVDTQAALVQQLEAALLADRAAERTAQLNVDFTSIRAPVTGVIGLRAVDPGNLVGSNTTGGIATITQVNPIDVVFSVPQDRIPAVVAAQRAGKLPVSALDRARTRTLASGTLLTLDNQINTATGTVRAKARFGNADFALFPNQFVNARLLLGHDRGVLVPLTALRTGPQGDYVYVVDDERVAHMRAVTRGIATAEQVLIAKGLDPGERVIAEGGDRVKDGARVQLAAPGGSTSAAGGRARGASAPATGSASAPATGSASAPATGSASAPAARSASGPAAGRARAAAAGSATAPGAAASAPAEGRPPWLERLPPEQRDKVLAMPPEERRAYLHKLRETRDARTGPSGR
ncbi:MAG: efflux RND transporter periplasmic adaptor subunit, partial [Comamonadaceae bacterium]|nr:efflux RND transporter periplasmic adaptor subunit [Comamonadaceae bacterium]